MKNFTKISDEPAPRKKKKKNARCIDATTISRREEKKKKKDTSHMQTKHLAFWPESGRVARERDVISLVIFRNKTANDSPAKSRKLVLNLVRDLFTRVSFGGISCSFNLRQRSN